MSGMSVVQVQLNDEIEDKEEFWAKFKHGVNEFKAQLPRGVVAVMVMDDFGDSSALLITMESDDKTYRQLLHVFESDIASIMGYPGRTQRYQTAEQLKQYFGEEHAQEIADLYHDFYYSYWCQKKSDFPCRRTR